MTSGKVPPAEAHDETSRRFGELVDAFVQLTDADAMARFLRRADAPLTPR